MHVCTVTILLGGKQGWGGVAIQNFVFSTRHMKMPQVELLHKSGQTGETFQSLKGTSICHSKKKGNMRACQTFDSLSKKKSKEKKRWLNQIRLMAPWVTFPMHKFAISVFFHFNNTLFQPLIVYFITRLMIKTMYYIQSRCKQLLIWVARRVE